MLTQRTVPQPPNDPRLPNDPLPHMIPLWTSGVLSGVGQFVFLRYVISDPAMKICLKLSLLL